MKKKLNLLFLFTAVSFFLTACIKDTDFNQTEEILITPEIELDFLFFELNSENFTNIAVNNLIVSDTTNFDFLNEEFVVENLIRAEFYFKYTNSFPVDFITEYQFLDENNDIHYDIIVPVNFGSIDDPLITEHVENIEGEGIVALTHAEKVVVTITASSPVDSIEGILKLQSKTTYFLRIEQ